MPTKIEWTDESWNPIRARNRETGKVGWFCSHLTPGCERCYAESINHRLGTGIDYKAQNRDKVEIFLDEEMLAAPLRWRRPRRIFVCSMTDLFAEFVPDQWIDRIFAIMALCPQHTFQVLTKRAGRMRDYLNGIQDRRAFTSNFWPLPNVWLGTSVEDQPRADERIPLLLATPAAVRWISAEPLLGPVDLNGWVFPVVEGGGRINWVIVGGESGPGARPFHIAWARSVIAQCKAAGVRCFVKQLGAVPIIEDVSPFNGSLGGEFPNGFPDGTFFGNRTGRMELNGLQVLLRDRKGGNPEEWAPDLRVREYPAQERA